MKKLIIVILIVLFEFQLYGQCSFDRKKDPITGCETISTSSDVVGLNGPYLRIRFSITLVLAKDTTLRLYIHLNRVTKRCFGPESKIQIKSGREVVDLKLSGDSICGVNLSNYAELSLATFRLLSRNDIILTRVFYLSDYDDFNVEYGNSVFFKQKFKCLTKKYPHYFGTE